MHTIIVLIIFVLTDAEVYEVHPKTRLRITTRSPTTRSHQSHLAQTTTHVKPVETLEPEEADYYTYQDDYVYEPTTSESSRVDEETTTTASQEYVPTVRVITEAATDEPTTETADVTDANNDVHETADKHSTTTLPTFVETTFRYDEEENVVDVDRIDLDIENEIDDQIVEESQQIETTWNGVVKVEDHTAANTRLSSYDKKVDTSKYGDDTEYNVTGLEPQVNEHSKPGHSGGDTEQSWHQTHLSPVRSYYEINRAAAESDSQEPIVKIEEVEITASKDYSEPDILYDVTKDGFDDDDKDSFSVPVAVSFNVPSTNPVTTTSSDVVQETTAPTTVKIDETTTVTEARPTTTTTIVEETTSTTTQAPTTTTTVAQTTTVAEEITTTAVPTTERIATTNRIYSLIQRNRQNILATTSRSVLGEVFLGSRPRPTTVQSSTTAPTTVVIDLSKSAHKVPNSLWSTFEKSRDTPTTTSKDPVVVELSDNTEAGVMSYTTPDNTNETKVIKELPKPSEHESEVLVENKVALKENENGGFVPRRKISSKGKEKWIKDWVSRKYNKPKFPRGPLLPFAPSHHRNQVNLFNL